MRPGVRRVLSVIGKIVAIRRPVIGRGLERIAEGNLIPDLPVQQKEPTPMFEAMKGKKTYLAMAIGAAVIVINHFWPGVVPGVQFNPDNWMSDLFTMAAGATMRAGIAKAGT